MTTLTSPARPDPSKNPGITSLPGTTSAIDRQSSEARDNPGDIVNQRGSLTEQLAHDINNILMSLIWILDLLGRSRRSRKDKERIAIAMNGARLCMDLIRDLSILHQVPSPAVMSDSGPIDHDAAVILLVESDAALRSDITTYLTALGYRVIDTDTVGSALDLLHVGPPFKLVITNDILPGLVDGYSLARYVAEIGPDIRTIITCDAAAPEVKDKTFTGELLKKPYDLEQLSKIISIFI